MTATIIYDINLIIGMPTHNYRQTSNGASDKIAWLWHLTIMAYVNPNTFKYAFHFQFKNRIVTMDNFPRANRQ